MIGSCLCGACRWTFKGVPGHATLCNCTLCRRYGVLWAYGYEGEDVELVGPSAGYIRKEEADPSIEIRFCPTCGCLLGWRGLKVSPEGRRRLAVNLRLTDPKDVAEIPIERLDGFGSFTHLPTDGRCVQDYWF